MSGSTEQPRLIKAATRKEVGRPGRIAAYIAGLDLNEIVGSYHEMVDQAPRRGDDGFPYFKPRTGFPTSGRIGNRYEEYLCMALANDHAVIPIDAEQIDILMYQFPLYTKGGPRGMRGVDVVGHSHQQGRFWVIEAKVKSENGRGQTPLRALYEGLIYAAIVEANHKKISEELASEQFLRESVFPRPGIVVTAPSNYWRRWTADKRTGDWWPVYTELVSQLSDRLRTPIEVIDLGEVWFAGVAGEPFHLTGEVTVRKVWY